MCIFRAQLAVIFLLSACTGCSSLLPRSSLTNELPWNSYQQAQQVFDSITPEKTTLDELHGLGIHPDRTPNVSLLNHTDVRRRLAITANLDLQFLPPQLQKCIASHQSCHAYEIEQKHLDHQRHGNFWMDFLNFHRQTNTIGWQFDALIIMQDDMVVYKLWSGKPNILLQEEERSPLGPFQGLGSSQWKR